MEWLIPYKVDDDYTAASEAPVPPATKDVSSNWQENLPSVAFAGACVLAALAAFASGLGAQPRMWELRGSVVDHDEPALRHPGAIIYIMGR